MTIRAARVPRRRACALALVLVAAGLAAPAAPVAAASGPARPAVTAAVSAEGRFVLGERLWVAGRVVGAREGRTVRLQARLARSGGWTTVSRAETRAGGRYTLSVRPEASGRLRVVTASSRGVAAATSRPLKVTRERVPRSLAERARALGDRAGAATSARQRLTRAARARAGVPGARAVVQQRRAEGLLVEVTSRTARRTWFVTGPILSRYLADGGTSGRWGVPRSDARCGLPGGGCVQTFARGTLYAARGLARASASTVRGRAGEVVAVARSQVGYADAYAGRGPHTTRYNAWAGSSKAWCSIFLSWAGQAAGSDAVPVAKSYTSFVRKVRATMPTGRTPRPGAIAFVSTRPPHSEPNHVMLVTAVSADGRTLNVIDGNHSVGRGRRGVSEQKWPAAQRVLFYAYPRY